jgi:hypothetical protein
MPFDALYKVTSGALAKSCALAKNGIMIKKMSSSFFMDLQIGFRDITTK